MRYFHEPIFNNVELISGSMDGITLMYGASDVKSVTSLFPPEAFLTKKEGEIYSSFTPKSWGLAKIPF